MSVTFTLARFVEHDEHGVILEHVDSDLALNVSNANACALLDRLGFDAADGRLWGECSGDDMLGRALVGNIGRDDSGVDATTVFDGEWVGGGAQMIDCGVRPGYYEDRMDALVALASYAKEHDMMVGWA